MKILYGIQGTGNGHISRARVLAKKLAQYPDISITYLFSGRAKNDFFDMEVFGDYLHFDGLTFISKNGKIDHWATFKKNSLIKLLADIKNLDVSEFDLIITDFEPITAWVGKLRKKTVLGIGHQYAFNENIPMAGDNVFTRLLIKNFAPTECSLGLHWHPYGKNVLPPIIDTNLISSNKNQHVLIYLPFEEQAKITELLQQIPNVKFIQYAPNLSENQFGNVETKKTNYAGFKADLTNAAGVICNSGFELISECLHLGLPILTKPLTGQMEQHSNALALKQLAYAYVIDELTYEQINHWCKNKVKPSAKPLPDVAGEIARAIANNQWHNTTHLHNKLWARN